MKKTFLILSIILGIGGCVVACWVSWLAVLIMIITGILCNVCLIKHGNNCYKNFSNTEKMSKFLHKLCTVMNNKLQSVGHKETLEVVPEIQEMPCVQCTPVVEPAVVKTTVKKKKNNKTKKELKKEVKK